MTDRTRNSKIQQQWIENKEKALLDRLTIGKGKRFFEYPPTLGFAVLAKIINLTLGKINWKQLFRGKYGTTMWAYRIIATKTEISITSKNSII